MSYVERVLANAHKDLGWPDREAIFAPEGSGAAALVRAAEEKIARALRQFEGAAGVRVGVLTDAVSATTAPVAVVCEFPRSVPEATRLQAQRLAWNFSRTNLLVTVEPDLIRGWTCSEHPLIDRDGQTVGGIGRHSRRKLIVLESAVDPGTGNWADNKAAAGLHWVELVSGHIFRVRPQQFRETRQAHRTLLDNLREVRRRLQALELADRYTHDLLARIIFVQFLFDRKDSQGQAALDVDWLARLHEAGQLSKPHQSLSEVLCSADDTYALFGELNRRFNGDLFPRKSDPEAWADERRCVKEKHLQLLAEFVDGRGDFATGQLSLWRRYAFDAIPLDVISSIYEEFVNGEGVGVHYTPGHVVDHILDRVLPWEGEGWDVRVLDPACGSGIFLVKAYQRLVHRWRGAHGAEVPVHVLQQLLMENVFGVDTDPEAVRVTAFSLYLAMCDEIDPKTLWEHPDTVFPQLRDVRIIHGDFFDDRIHGLRTSMDIGTYDLAIGNPPWGDRTLGSSTHAIEWAESNGWKVANLDFGALFLAKAAELVRAGGRVGLVQSAASVLYNAEATARALQRRIFLEHRRIESVTLLPPRLHLFRGARVPICVLVLENRPPDGSAFLFEAPKRQQTIQDRFEFVLDAHDIHWITPAEVVAEPWLWSVLAWGGERHRTLIRRLRRLPTLASLKAAKQIETREGVNRGKTQRHDELLGFRYLATEMFPGNSPFRLNGTTLPKNVDPMIAQGASKNLAAFQLPQLLLKRSLLKDDARFQARIVEGEAVLCEKKYVSVHGPREIIEPACLIYNSDVATYFLFLTSGRFAFDRNNPNVEDLRAVPLPRVPAGTSVFAGLHTDSDIQERSLELLGTNETERLLIEDLVDITFADERGHDLPGREPTNRGTSRDEPYLTAYGNVYRRVVHAAYSGDMRVLQEIATIGPSGSLPVRVVRFLIGPAVPDDVTMEARSLDSVRAELARAYNAARAQSDSDVSLRCLRVYGTSMIDEQRHLSITYVKPDQVRFWTRTSALRDADELAADLSAWALTEDRDSRKEAAVA